MHTNVKNATRKSVIFFKNASGSFFWCDAPRQKLSDQWDWCFCSRVWSCWSYSKTQLGDAQTQNSLAEHTYATTKKTTLPASASFLIQQKNNFFIAGASGAWNIHVFFVWFWQARKYLLSSSEWQASVRSVKLRSATLCTGVFLFYIKRHLMSGNEFACSLGSSSAKIAWVWRQKRVEKRWRITRADIRPGVYGPRLTLYIFYKYMCSLGIEPTTFCAADAMLYHWATGTQKWYLSHLTVIWLRLRGNSSKPHILTYLCVFWSVEALLERCQKCMRKAKHTWNFTSLHV